MHEINDKILKPLESQLVKNQELPLNVQDWNERPTSSAFQQQDALNPTSREYKESDHHYPHWNTKF